MDKRNGYLLAIGLNHVDKKHYQGWNGTLVACENDVKTMSFIAKHHGYEVTTLLTKQATRQNVKENIREIAKLMNPNDIFILSYSGHGGQIKDRNNDETDKLDETWCLYDGQLIDDELSALFSEFKENSRILVFSDSCHSGTMIKQAYLRKTNKPIYRQMPYEIQDTVYKENKGFYSNIYAGYAKPANTDKQNIILISACQDNQFAADGKLNGLFTGTLAKVWNKGLFDGNYYNFHKAIMKQMPPQQTPNIIVSGNNGKEFSNENIFKI